MWQSCEKYVAELSQAIEILYTQVNITYVFTTKQAKYKTRNRMRQAMPF